VLVNARAALGLPDGLSALVWKYAGEPAAAPRTLADVPPVTPASKALSAELKRHGFTFTGPVTAYATMQACGIVNDHLAGCFARELLQAGLRVSRPRRPPSGPRSRPAARCWCRS
jgi:DNA-3-methyladenine glycosylase I